MPDPVTAPPVDDEVKRIVTVLTPVTGLVATVLAGLGGLTGSFSVTMRNEPQLVYFGASTLLVGLLYTAWAFFRHPGVEPKNIADRNWSLTVALFAFALAFFFGILATVRTVHNAQQPSIELAWNVGSSTLTGSVTGRDLRTETQLYVAIRGLPKANVEDPPLWQSVVSADNDGTATLPFSLEVLGQYDELLVVAWADQKEPDCAGPFPLPSPDSGLHAANLFGPQPLSACALVGLPSDTQVNRGGVNTSMIRDFKGTIEREGAQIGLFITLEEPSKPMLLEASTAGVYASPISGKDYPRIQILSIRQQLEEHTKPCCPCS